MAPSRELAYVALGSNLGDRVAHLARGVARLAVLPDTDLLAATAVEETEPIGPPQPRYLNQMVLLRTRLAPRALLQQCHAIEEAEGRVRGPRWGPRTLDLDIVQYDDLTIAEPGLIVPHPALPQRQFWQREIAELNQISR